MRNESAEQRRLLGITLTKGFRRNKYCVEVLVSAITLVPYPMSGTLRIHLCLKVGEFAGTDLILDVDAKYPTVSISDIEEDVRFGLALGHDVLSLAICLLERMCAPRVVRPAAVENGSAARKRGVRHEPAQEGRVRLQLFGEGAIKLFFSCHGSLRSA